MADEQNQTPLPTAGIPSRIKEVMAAKGWRVADLGRATKLDQAYLGQLLAGRYQNPGVLTLLHIADALEVSLCWLVTREAPNSQE